MNRTPGVCLAALLLAACGNNGDDGNHIINTYPESNSQAFHTYSRHCSQCHAPPKPDAHTASEWPSVVARMQDHIVQRGLPSLPDGERTDILGYLESHAKVKP